MYITGRGIGHADIAHAAQKHGLSVGAHSALKRAHDAGHITKDTHLYGAIRHAGNLQSEGLNEKAAIKTAIEFQKKNPSTVSDFAGESAVKSVSPDALSVDPERFQFKVHVGARRVMPNRLVR